MSNVKKHQPNYTKPTRAQDKGLREWFSEQNDSATILEDYDFTENKDFVANVYEEYISMAADFIATPADPAATRGAVDSFFESPVVRAAFRTFLEQCYDEEITEILENELISAIRASAPAIRDDADDAEHDGSDSAARDEREKLRRIVTEYLVRVDTWRRAGLAHGRRGWAFGASEEARVDLLGSTLLQLWYMEREGCFERRRAATDGRDWGVFWEMWAERCRQLEAVDAAGMKDSGGDGRAGADGTEVFVGVGCRPDGWLQKDY